MRPNSAIRKLLAAFFVLLALPVLARAQAGTAQIRITQPVDDTKLTVLKGNTHPLARAEFDRGAAPAGMQLHRMLLSLKRSPGQETALQQLLVNLQDRSSTSYHKWLTPVQFGQQFGAADPDIQTIASWLGSHGFEVTNVTKGRTVVEFSGTVAQVKEAFHTDIHKFVVNGEEHWANASDPQIPTALAPVVAGVSTLHNFVKKPHFKLGPQLTGTRTGGPRPAINLQGQNNQVFHALGPGDFATIYNTPTFLNIHALAPLFNGDGVTIAIVARSNINASDVQEFRNIFGIVTTNLNIILDGPDPGNLGGGEEVEAVLDATWSSSVAPNATIDFVTSQTTETTDGVDLSEVFIIDNNLAPVMSESFGECEQGVGSAQETNEANLAEQAAAQGITFMASTGDAGAEGCDDPNSETTATGPIAVQIPAALPFTVAVGGTMFTANDSAFWNANNSNTFESANSFIPEDVWNESCATATGCPADVVSAGAVPNILAGSGGASIFFTKPAFQSGVSGLSNFREVPDVSLNAAVFHDPAVLCVDDQGTSCSNPASFTIFTVGGTSVASPSFAGIMALVNQATGQRQGEAGFVLYKLAAAEVASPGLSACNASTGSGPTSTSCVFNDTTSGNNAVPGESGFGTSGADFQAGTGYDEASGLGSVNATNLINAWGTARSVTSNASLAIPTAFPVAHGTPVSANITVTGNGGTPSGDVSLIANTGASASGQTGSVTLAKMTLVGGTVSTTTTDLPGGSYTVTAHYEGDGTFLPSDSTPVNVNIGKENSNVQVEVNFSNPITGALSNNVSSVQFGSNYLIRMNVTGASGACAGNSPGASGCPTGTITLTDNGHSLDAGTFALNSTGYAEDQLETLSVGSHTLAATYSGDSSFNGNSATDSIFTTVTQGTTTSVATATPSSIVSGGSVTLSAVISTQSFSTPPTGTVTFFNGSTQLGSPVTVAGSFSITTPGFAQATASLVTTLSKLPAPVGVNRGPLNLRMHPVWIASFFIAMLCLLALTAMRTKRNVFAYSAVVLALLLMGTMAACGGGGGGGGGGGHTDTITAKYSGDTNYAPSSATVSVSVQ
jgi:hypothetical protein